MFRKADSHDAERLSALINSAYRGDSARVGWTFESDLVEGQRVTAAEIRNIVIKSEEFYLLLEENQDLIACAYVQMQEDSYAIGMLTVKPELQNSGLGSRLLQEVEKRAREAGKKFTRLDVIHVRSELISYYERKGYKRTGAQEPFPPQYPAKVPGLMLIELKKTL